MTLPIIRKCKICGLPFAAEDDDETACEKCWDLAIAEMEFISFNPKTETVH